MEEWKDKKQRVIVCSQGGKKEEGHIIDFDDTEIVLEEGEEGQWTPIKRKICHNWFSVVEMRDWE